MIQRFIKGTAHGPPCQTQKSS